MDGYGREAYEGYRAHSKGKSLISGQQIPEWTALPQAIQEAWNAAARAVIRAQYPQSEEVDES